MKVDQILLDIHTFLLTHPDQMWKNRADDTPLRTIKTILYTLGKLKKQEVSKFHSKDLAKLGNVVVETLFLLMWLNWKTFVSEAKFASELFFTVGVIS